MSGRKRRRGRAAETPSSAAPDRAPETTPSARAAGPALGPRAAAAGSALVVLAALALGVHARLEPAREVVHPTPERTDLLGVDAYYHARHTERVAGTLPVVPRLDLGTHYPKGERAEHPGLFNVGIAVVTHATGEASRPRLERVAAWSPVVLFGLGLLLAAAVGAWVAGPTGAAVTAVAAVAFPGLGLARTLYGFADHHAAEMLLAPLVAWGLGVRLARPDDARIPRPALLAGLPLVLFLFTWAGAALHVAVAGAALGLIWLLRVAAGAVPRELTRPTLGWCLGVVLPTALMAALLPSWVQKPVILALGLAALVGLAAAVPIANRLAAALGARGLSGPPLAVGLALVSVIGLVGLIAFAPGGDRVYELVFAPKTLLVGDHTVLDLATLHWLYGPLPVLAAVGLGLSARRLLRDPGEAGRSLVLAVGLVTAALAIRTGDYGYLLAVAFGLPAGLAIRDAARLARRRAGTAGELGAIGLGAAALVLPPLLGWTMPIRPSLDDVVALRVVSPAWVGPLRWLAENTPAPVPGVDAERPAPSGPVTALQQVDRPFGEGSYGVFTQWSFGNFVGYFARRTPVWSHGVTRPHSRWFDLEDEDAAVAGLCPDCAPPQHVPFVVVDAFSLSDGFLSTVREGGGDTARFTGQLAVFEHGGRKYPLKTFGPAYDRLVASRLYYRDGQDLGRFRLVTESDEESFLAYRMQLAADGPKMRRTSTPVRDAPHRAELADALARGAVRSGESIVYAAAIMPSVKIYRVVPGARLRGSAAPGARVVARIDMGVKASQRRFTYEHGVPVGPDGRFELRVPYPSDVDVDDLTPLSKWTIEVVRPDGSRPETRSQFPVTEAQIRSGVAIELGPLQ